MSVRIKIIFKVYIIVEPQLMLTAGPSVGVPIAAYPVAPGVPGAYPVAPGVPGAYPGAPPIYGAGGVAVYPGMPSYM